MFLVNQMKFGAILSYLSIFVTILVALLYTPVIIRLLGQAEYGLYSLIGSLIAYFSIMDLGLGNAIVRYTARNRAIGDKEAESRLNGMFLVLYSFIGLLTVIVGIIVYNMLDNIFASNLTVTELEKAKIMLIIITINFAFSFPLAIFGSIMQAYERFVIVKLLAMVRTVAVPLITLPILLMGYASVAMVLVAALVNISCLLFNVYYSFKKLNISFHYGKIDIALLKEILGYSFFVFLGVIVDQIYWNTDQFILGAVAGTIPVAVYAIAMQFIRLYMQFSSSISSLFLPKTSILVANNASGEELTTNMIRYGRMQFIIMALIFSGFILFGQSFISFWAGSNYNDAYYITLIVMIPVTIPLIQNFGISVLYAKNKQKFRSVILIIIAILNVAISIPLARQYGGGGAALATAVSLSLGNIFLMNIYYHRKIGIDMINFWISIIRMSFPVLLLLLGGLTIKHFLSSPSIFLLCVQIFIFLFVYILVVWKFSLKKYEKKFYASIVLDLKRLIVRNY